MTQFIITGSSVQAIQLISKSLTAVGVGEAYPSQRDKRTAREVQKLLRKYIKNNRIERDHTPHTSPSRIGDILAADLFLANAEQTNWHFTSEFDPVILDYWKSFDPDIKLILVYVAAHDHIIAAANSAKETITRDWADQQLDDWKKHQEALLNYFYTIQDSAVLVHAGSVIRDQQSLARTLKLEIETLASGGRQPANISDQSLHPSAYPLPKGEDIDYDLTTSSACNLPENMLAHKIVEGHPQASSLQQELDSTAHIPPITLPVTFSPFDLWQSLSSINRAYTELKTSSERQTQLIKEHEASLSVLEAKILSLNETKEDNASLLLQLHDVQEELEKFLLNQDSPKKTNRQANNEVKTDQDNQAKLKKENQLLLLQLHQVQEELEKYYLKYQDYIKNDRQSLFYNHFERRFWLNNCPAILEIDLGQNIEGEGWYEAESDGRWTGPGLESTLKLPPLPAGDYRIDICLADAMQPDIACGYVVAAILDNGKEQALALSHEFSLGEHLYPMTSSGILGLPNLSTFWQLKLTAPYNTSPSELSGSDDLRQLGLRIRSITLYRLFSDE